MIRSRLYSPPFQLLELNVISGQDLAEVSRKMRTYAVAWVHPDRKLTTRIDIHGHNNPTWNDKFVFRVNDEFLQGETSAIMIEIYALHWFHDVHVGTVRVIVGNVIPPAQLAPHHHRQHLVQLGMRFIALQVRRRSGRPQGILNIGVALLDASMRSMPLYSQTTSAVGYRHLMGQKNHNKKDRDDDSNSDNQSQFLLPWIPKPELRRTKSESSSMFGSHMIGNQYLNPRKGKKKVSSATTDLEIGKMGKKSGSSTASTFTFGGLTRAKYGSDLSSATNRKLISNQGSPKPKLKGGFQFAGPELITDSELGPSASEVAAALMRNKKRQFRVEETESEIMGSWSLESNMEGLKSKLERWRTELPPAYDWSELSSLPDGKVPARFNRERSSDGGFSCFSRICGLECSIVCGGSSVNKKLKRTPSQSDFSFL